MNRLPIWAQWALVPVLTVLMPIILSLAPEMFPVIILCLPIAAIVGLDNSPRNPVWNWRKDRA